MPLLKEGQIITDPWNLVGTGNQQTISERRVVISFEELASFLENADPSIDIGVSLKSETDAELLKPYITKLKLVVLNFPVFRDGRPFSQARKLREMLKFNGEIRATGNVLPDQYQFLHRTGFSTVEVAETADIALWHKAFHQFTESYQPSIVSEVRGKGLRWQI